MDPVSLSQGYYEGEKVNPLITKDAYMQQIIAYA